MAALQWGHLKKALGRKGFVLGKGGQCPSEYPKVYPPAKVFLQIFLPE